MGKLVPKEKTSLLPPERTSKQNFSIADYWGTSIPSFGVLLPTMEANVEVADRGLLEAIGLSGKVGPQRKNFPFAT